MKNITNTNGITLITLIITIILLLIISGIIISLNMENGILDQTTKAKQETKEAEIEEQIKLAVISAKMKNNGKLATDILNTELQTIFNDDKTVIECTDYYLYNRNKSYKIYGNGEIKENNSILPDEYQQVEFIESTGTQYISIGEIQISNLIAELQYPDYPNNCALNGGMDARGNIGRFGVGIDVNNLNYKFVYGDQADIASNIAANSQKHTYKINISKNNIKTAKLFVDDVFIYELTAKNISHPLYFTLFAYTGWGETTPNKFASCRIYKFELDNQIKLYPCYRVSDNVIGMYDTVKGKFYTNQGNGTFIKGNDI